jgi:predicted dehydrogenase
VISVGPGDWFNYAVHSVEMYQTLVGPGARWLQSFSTPERDITVIGYHTRPTVIVQTLRDAGSTFHMTVYAAKGRADCEVNDYDGFYTGTMSAMLDMVRTGRAPISREETLEILAILHAGMRSAETGQRIEIADMFQS